MTPEEALEKCVNYVKRWMKPKLSQGVVCPCCGKKCKKYARPLNNGMARMMLALYRAETDGEGWAHVTRFEHVDGVDLGVVNGDYTYLKHWGLLEAKRKENGEPASGVWRLTELGKKFVSGEVVVPRKVVLVNDILIETSEETTDIYKALGERFDYKALVGWSSSGDEHHFLRMYVKYSDYILRSDQWAEKRRRIIKRSRGVCERCLLHSVDDIHHLTYENVFNEPDEDLWGLCRGCHEFVHGKSDHDPDTDGYWAGLEKDKRAALTAREINCFFMRRQRNP